LALSESLVDFRLQISQITPKSESSKRGLRVSFFKSMVRQCYRGTALSGVGPPARDGGDHARAGVLRVLARGRFWLVFHSHSTPRCFLRTRKFCHHRTLGPTSWSTPISSWTCSQGRRCRRFSYYSVCSTCGRRLGPNEQQLVLPPGQSSISTGMAIPRFLVPRSETKPHPCAVGKSQFTRTKP